MPSPHRDRDAPLGRPHLALVRDISASFQRSIRQARAPLDLDKAAEQHAAYVDELAELGVDVRRLGPLPECPDAVFVEDTAVVLGDHALLTRPGARARRREVESVREGLEPWRQLHTMEPPATLDGGDVLRAGPRLFVGLSERTNQEGLARLADIAALEGLETIPVAVQQGLHLKSACTLLDAHTLLLCDGRVDARPFKDAGLDRLVVREPAGANVVALGSVILMSAAAPKSADVVAKRGYEPRLVDVGEMHKADGALTCLSLRIAQKGEWTA